MEIKTLGIDLAKRSFQVHGVNGAGKAVLRKKLDRKDLIGFMAQLPTCTVLMESCATSHFWGNKFKAMGHEVKLIAAQFVKPFVKSQKNDRNDAEAIVEAGLRPSMRFVALKDKWQQDIQCLQRARKRGVRARTSIINQTKGLLLEYGVVVEEKGDAFRAKTLDAIEEAENELTPAMRTMLNENIKEFDFVSHLIKLFDEEIKKIAQSSDDCKRLMAVPGVGLLGATAFVASVGDPGVFKNGRHVASWLGLVPKQHSTGGIPRLLSITKRGDPELRALLIHGARANLLSMMRKKKKDHLSEWALALLETKGWGKTSVALANKMARIMWHILKYKEEYRMA